MIELIRHGLDFRIFSHKAINIFIMRLIFIDLQLKSLAKYHFGA